MRGFIGLTKRNLLIYFKDIPAVIFSLLTSIIVFVLYLIFLKGNYVDVITSFAEGLDNFIDSADIDTLVSAILLVGIVGSAMITVPYSCLSTVIKDRENKIDYDVCATPVKRWQIIMSYFVAAVICAILVSWVILTVGLCVIGSSKGLYLNVGSLINLYAIVVVGSISATAIFLVMAMFFKSSSSSSAFFGMLSAASGFVIGAYIPLAQFSENVQTICNLFPATQITVLFRNVLMGGVLEHIDGCIGGVDNGAFVEGIKNSFSFESCIMSKSLTVPQMYTYIGVIFAISIAVMIAVYSKTYKRR